MSLSFKPLGEILKKPDVEKKWRIENLAIVGGISLVVGKPKCGKSVFAKNLALAVAQGELFLGLRTSRAPVLYLALEDHEDEVRRDFRALGATGEEELHLHVAIAPEQPLIELRMAIDQYSPGLVVIDTIFKFARVRDLNDYSQVNMALEPLLDLARKSGTHILGLHHAKKGHHDEGDSVLGSTAIFGGVDTLISINKGKYYRTVSTTARFGTDIEPSVLEMNLQTKRLRLAGTKEQADIRYYEDRIRRFLQTSCGEYYTEKELREEVSAKTGTFKKALRQLVKTGSIIRLGGGKKNDAFKYGVESVADEIVVPAPYKSEGNYNNNTLSIQRQDCGSPISPNTGSQELEPEV